MPPLPPPHWHHSLLRLAVIYAAALALGVAVDRVWMLLALTSTALLCWHSWHLARVLRLLQARRWMPQPTGHGAWDALEHLIHRDQRQIRSRRQRLLMMLRAYRAAAAVLPDAIVIVERNSQRVVWFNEAATQLLDLHYPRDIGAPLGERLQPIPTAIWLSGGRHAEPLMDVAAPHDPALRLSLRLVPYSDQQWLLIARNVSKLVHLEQVRRDFVANVSHELRTPLTVVHGYLDMLEPDDMPEWAPILTEMRSQSQRMTQLVEDLLTLSRLEAQDRLDEERVPMTPLLATLRREAEALGQGRQRVSVIDDAGCDLWGSSRELHSAFSNLVSNAVRYTPAGGSIEVRFAPAPDGALLSVRDTGFGIPAQHLPRLTERFYRVSTSRSREKGGTGLGLSIVKHVLSLHQATLHIVSEVGQGSTFSCHFGAERLRPRDLPRGAGDVPPQPD